MSNRDDSLLLDMLLAARRVRRFTASRSVDEFLTDEVLQSAVIHQLQIIGEAASHISPETQRERPEISWHEIIGLRHRLVHDYAGVNLARVWSISRDSVPKLIEALEQIVP